MGLENMLLHLGFKPGILFIVYGNDTTHTLNDHVKKKFLIDKIKWYKSHFDITVINHAQWEIGFEMNHTEGNKYRSSFLNKCNNPRPVRSTCRSQYHEKVVVISIFKLTSFNTWVFNTQNKDFNVNTCSVFYDTDFLNPNATIMLFITLFSVDPCLIYVFISRWTHLMSFIWYIYAKVKCVIWCWMMLVPYITCPDWKEKEIATLGSMNVSFLSFILFHFIH